MAYNVGILGATGAVGQEIIRLLHEREFPIAELRLLASARSAGKEQSFGGETWTIQEAAPESFEGLDICIFSAGGDQSKLFADEAVKRGCVVVDNSSAFRQDPDVPLVIPEINPDAVDDHKGILANPNCSTAISLMGLYPLHKAFGLKSFIASTYQAVSGSGALGHRRTGATSPRLGRGWRNKEGRFIRTRLHLICYHMWMPSSTTATPRKK
jgi:aspartate-semialdehyde dehydrogenase